MKTGFKYATLSDGTTTVTLSNLLASSKYNKKQLTKKDVDDKLIVVEERADLLLISTDVEDTAQLRNWMINKIAITSIKIYGTDFTINWLESSKIIISNVIPTAVGGRIKVKVMVKAIQERLSNINVVATAS